MRNEKIPPQPLHSGSKPPQRHFINSPSLEPGSSGVMWIYFSVESQPYAGFSLITRRLPRHHGQAHPWAPALPQLGELWLSEPRGTRATWLSRWAHLARCPRSSCTHTRPCNVYQEPSPCCLLPVAHVHPYPCLPPSTLPSTSCTSSPIVFRDEFEHLLCT